MDLGSDAEWILSRKIVVKSVTRHFAPWKSRFFLLDRVNAMLEIRTSATSGATRVPLTSSNLVIQRHEYSADNGYLLTVRYNDEDTTTIREIVMKFDSLEHLTYWEKALKSTAENVQSVTAGSTLALLQSFMEFTNEQLQLQTIVESESQYEAQYFNTAVGSKKTDTPGSLDVSFMDASSTISTGDDASPGGTGTLHLQPATVSESDGPLPLPPGAIKISPLRVPRMHILLVAVGTRGDMQPFVQLGLRLLQDGHRVRLATHACFRDAVTSKGLEFYPLAGDPLKLSEFMVKTQGFVIPTTPELLMEAPIYHRMVVDMMYSCWGACVDPDPEDPLARKFVADAIISNPVSYAHIHCAEALGVPLHLMFPQPWTPTKAFPHPLSCLSYQQGWSSENYISYQVVDSMLWMSFERHINAFRTTVLGLEPLRVGEGGWNHLNVMQVPFAKMWSPSFVPKPKDWPAHVDVVGTFFDAPAILPTHSAGDNASDINSIDKPSTALADIPHGLAVPRVEIDFQPPADLARFLESGETPVFVGFGSMVVKDLEGLISLFLEGAALAGVRIIVQLGWTAISSERFLELALQAQLKASIVRETEQLHDAMASSVIFPSSNSSALPGRGRSGPLGGSLLRGGNLTMSMRSVESTSTVDEDVSRDESTLDGEAVLSNPSGFINGTVSGKNCVSGMYTSSVTAQSLDTPVCAPMRGSEEGGDFDSSPISTPERDSTECAAGPEQGGENSGLGTWLYGAAAKLGRSFQQQRGKQNPSLQSPTSGPDGHAAPSGRGGAVQDDWDEVTVEGWTAARDALFIGPCPHDWLFQHVAGVVHHGGAGTTAAGLRFGRPTWVCPFFGDQHFWGEMVHRRRVGPKPCPIGALTLPVVADSLSMLVDREMTETAAVLARSMATEDGVESACSAFYKHLPLESMLCDVSLFRGEHRLAQVYCQDCGLKMCLEVSQQVHSAPGLHLQDHRPAPCCYKDWTRPAPNSAADGLLQGIGGLVHELKEGVSDLVYDPVQGIYTHGISGAAAGLSSGLHSLLSRPLAGGSVLLNKVKEGIRASLASNLQYGVTTSPYDPLLRDGISVTGTGRDSPVTSQHTQHRRSGSHNPSRIRSLKLALPELPPVSDASFRTDPSSPPVPVSQAALGGSVMLLGSALGCGRSSPRGRRVTSEDDGDSIPGGLNESRHTVASRDSAAFYCSKDSVLSPTGEVSDGDESECYEEDTAPFLLYNSQTQPAAVTAQPPVQASCVALSSSTVSSHSGGTSTEIEGCRAQGTTATRGGAGPEKDQTSPQGKPVVSAAPSIDTRRVKEGSPSNHAYPSSSGAHPAKAPTLTIRTKDPTPSDSAVDMTVEEAFTTAQAARKLFTDLGARNGRFITPREFGRVMHRACQREVAMCDTDPQQQQVHCITQPEADSGSTTALSAAQQLPSKVSGVDGTGYNEQSLAALLQMLAHGKRYVDFVDFALIYRDLHALAPTAPPPQQH